MENNQNNEKIDSKEESQKVERAEKPALKLKRVRAGLLAAYQGCDDIEGAAF